MTGYWKMAKNKVKLIIADEGYKFEQEVNKFIADKSIYDIQYRYSSGTIYPKYMAFIWYYFDEEASKNE